MEDAIENIKPGKSPGIDEITSEIVKDLGRTGTISLEQIFNKEIEEEMAKAILTDNSGCNVRREDSKADKYPDLWQF
ncbi:hypothetical protein ILUMI_21072 [Ignelater luminosus]|uniref:Uncharacterized protein n=1 Tax=Ignelater luminosus TaxID=2038154 RepID=A0A8K0CD34_IGNLU|nr:hypothetical protein ILUMI_21072 [Ignelater luminosus]